MGAHIVVRKKRMTRNDIALLLEKAAFVDVVCFLKETRYDDFEHKFGKGSLFISSVKLDDVPDAWIDYDGEHVFNNMLYSTAENIERVLGFRLPDVDSDSHDPKRGRGRAIVIRGSDSPPEPDPRQWMTVEELKSRLPDKPPKLAEDDEGRWVYKTFRAIADGGFDCRLLV